MEEHAHRTEYAPLSVGQWVVVLLLVSIPIVNVVLLFVWAFGEDAHPTKRNYSRANLIFLGIAVVVAAVFVAFAVLGQG